MDQKKDGASLSLAMGGLATTDPNAAANVVQNRVTIHKVTLEATPLLNLIKHCQDKKDLTLISANQTSSSNYYESVKNGVKGQLLGVLKKELVSSQEEENNLLITGIQIPELTDQNSASNDIGFYLSCQLGMAFSKDNLFDLINAYRNFRNSVMIVYDVNKSRYGLNPLKCFRLSEKAVSALSLNDTRTFLRNLVQEKIREHELDIQNFFEEVPMKIHRSNLIQAYLFDHIQPSMPQFNPNTFRLACSNELLSQHVFMASQTSKNLLEELSKIETQHKNQTKFAKKANKKIQAIILANKDKTIKGSQAEKEERQALEQFKVEDNSYNKMDLFLLSKQVDSLYSEIAQFDSCFPQEATPIN